MILSHCQKIYHYYYHHHHLPRDSHWNGLILQILLTNLGDHLHFQMSNQDLGSLHNLSNIKQPAQDDTGIKIQLCLTGKYISFFFFFYNTIPLRKI